MGILPDPRHEKIAQARARGVGVADSYAAGGYKKNAVAASKFMARPEIKARIAEIQELRNRISIQNEIATSRDIAHKLGITKERILKSLWDVAEQCLKAPPVLDKEGKPTGRQGKIDSVGAIRALELIGRETFGMFVEKVEFGEAGAFARLTDEELAKRVTSDAEALGIDPEVLEAALTPFGSNSKH